MKRSQRFILLSIILIAIGTVINNTAKIETQSLGVVLYAVGGLFLIIGMKKKKDEDAEAENNEAENNEAENTEADDSINSTTLDDQSEKNA
jgi:Ca2+/Na+ antiporter